MVPICTKQTFVLLANSLFWRTSSKSIAFLFSVSQMQSFHLPEEVLDVVNLDFEESDLLVGHLLLKEDKRN